MINRLRANKVIREIRQVRDRVLAQNNTSIDRNVRQDKVQLDFEHHVPGRQGFLKALLALPEPDRNDEYLSVRDKTSYSLPTGHLYLTALREYEAYTSNGRRYFEIHEEYHRSGFISTAPVTTRRVVEDIATGALTFSVYRDHYVASGKAVERMIRANGWKDLAKAYFTTFWTPPPNHQRLLAL